MRDADTAMYQAKKSGKARHVQFDQRMHEEIVYRLDLEKDLREALVRGQFELHYQPIIGLETGRLDGFEALVRWRHPHRGVVSPGEFVGLAEELNLIIPIGTWVLNEACRQLRIWHDRMAEDVVLTMNVNLSGQQLSDPGLVDSVRAALHEFQIDPYQLKLEMTESLMMGGDSEIIDAM